MDFVKDSRCSEEYRPRSRKRSRPLRPDPWAPQSPSRRSSVNRRSPGHHPPAVRWPAGWTI